MRRRPGIQGLQRKAATRERFTSVGEAVEAERVETAAEQLGVFKASLEAFALKHRDDIRRDPEFRAQFHKMCERVGVDPLASNKGLWTQLLGFGDFYYELGVQIVEQCMASRATNGGLLELGALLAAVRRRRGERAAPVSVDDLVQAIKKLRVLGGGFDVVKVGRKRLVRSIPGELNLDENAALADAEANGGWVSRERLEGGGWSPERADLALGKLLESGQAWVDDGAADGVRRYWFPCFWGVDAGGDPGGAT